MGEDFMKKLEEIEYGIKDPSTRKTFTELVKLLGDGEKNEIENATKLKNSKVDINKELLINLVSYSDNIKEERDKIEELIFDKYNEAELFLKNNSVENFKSLKKIDIYETFSNFQLREFVEIVNLANNLDKNIVIGFPKVTRINRSHENIQKLPEEGRELPSLAYCNLRDNELEAIPGIIAKSPNLQYVNLANNNISSLPIESVTNRENITELDLRDNKNLNENSIDDLQKLLPNCEIKK